MHKHRIWFEECVPQKKIIYFLLGHFRGGKGVFFMKWELVVIYFYISGLKTGKEPALLERTASHWYTYYLPYTVAIKLLA